jgi:CRISPR-associated protein Cas5t
MVSNMKILRLKLYQETACYRKSFSGKVAETYPLPPYSTVKGMFHSLIGAKEFVPMRISVQGEFDTKISDYKTHYFFKRVDSGELPIVLDGLPDVQYTFNDDNITQMPIYTHLLYGVRLVIHVEAADDVIDKIIESIEQADVYGSLGRWEDVYRIDEYKIVKVNELEEEVRMKYNAYILLKQIDLSKIKCVPYRLDWKYEIKNGIRQFERIKVGYVSKGHIAPETSLIDEDGELVFFNLEEL